MEGRVRHFKAAHGEETVDGERFYEAEEDLVETHDEGEARRRHDQENVPFDEPAVGDPAPVVLDEIPLPHMFVPGKIAHVYTHDGGYKAAYVPPLLHTW